MQKFSIELHFNWKVQSPNAEKQVRIVTASAVLATCCVCVCFIWCTLCIFLVSHIISTIFQWEFAFCTKGMSAHGKFCLRNSLALIPFPHKFVDEVQIPNIEKTFVFRHFWKFFAENICACEFLVFKCFGNKWSVNELMIFIHSIHILFITCVSMEKWHFPKKWNDIFGSHERYHENYLYIFEQSNRLFPIFLLLRLSSSLIANTFRPREAFTVLFLIFVWNIGNIDRCWKMLLKLIFPPPALKFKIIKADPKRGYINLNLGIHRNRSSSYLALNLLWLFYS